MKDNFVHREKKKRLDIACALQKSGVPLHGIAQQLGVQEETVKQYLEEAQRTESQSSNMKPLAQFVTATTTMDTLFASALQEGFKCVRCKRYAKREAGILWEDQLFMCKGCYLGLRSDELAQWRL
ncbi:hypothetical protein HY639_00270 [Candidatus Woesearchaeota archaeon]|nr:hypothetical protein [Candidatus Woesearchaeota archaeon]